MQSNHARVTAAAGAALGMQVVLVLNGTAPATPTGNARLDRLFGAEIRIVADARRARAGDGAARRRAARGGPPAVRRSARRVHADSAPLGFARGVAEIATSGVKPDVIVHASSSGGTQAGLDRRLRAARTAAAHHRRQRGRAGGQRSRDIVRELLEGDGRTTRREARRPSALDRDIEVDDSQVGGGYGVPTAASTEALELVARREGILLDPVYTAKAMAGLIARVRPGEFNAGPDRAVLAHWRTSGVLRVTLTFLGAARTVTGSKHLLEVGGQPRARRLRAVPGTQGTARAQLASVADSRDRRSTPSS